VRRIVKLFVLILVAAPAAMAQQSYYISNSIGSDSNNGTSKATPWLHAPGMPGCSGTCASTTPTAGDSFVFMGCDTWTFSGSWSWSGSGTGTSPITIGGTDQTWYNTSVCPSAWNRPILTGGGTWPGSTIAFMVNFGGSYVNFGWFEITGFYYNGVGPSSEIGIFTGGSNELVHDNYIHGWTHAAGASENENVNVYFSLAPSSRFYNNAVDGSDTDKDSFGGIYCGSSCGEIDHNYFAYQDDTINVSGASLIHDNTFFNSGIPAYSGSGDHNNAMESNGDPAAGMLVYDNYYIHNNGGANCGNACGVAIQIAPPSGTTSYFFNNVISDGPSSGNGLMCEQSISNPGGTCFMFNNTMECGPDAAGANQSCLRVGGLSGALPTTTQTNMHLITSTSPDSQTTPVVQTVSVANGQGYSLAQAYNFSPTASGSATVLAGTNMSSTCKTITAINAAAGTACLSDTTYGIAYNSTTHQITGSGRVPVLRPTGGTWDVGAYQFGGTSAGTPNPPTGLTAVVQ
jgi:hypothetical protein